MSRSAEFVRLDHGSNRTDVPTSRSAVIDLMRAAASHIIVLHHLTVFSPLSEIAYPLAPRAVDLVFDYGRMAVQVFFVLGGYFAARNLTRHVPMDLSKLGALIWQRYRRTGLPYLATLVIALLANALASRWMSHESVSPAPTIWGFLAHVFYLQDILGVPAITAGIWYLAIDLQLVIVTLLIAAACSRLASGSGPAAGSRALAAAQIVLALAAVASLFWFNRDDRYDVWAPYFLGSYFLGMALQWTLERKLPRPVFWLYALSVLIAVFLHWRPRLLVAIATALCIYLIHRIPSLTALIQNRLVAYLGCVSFSLFLVHFPICLVVSAGLSRWAVTPGQALSGLILAYFASIAGAMLFYRWVEVPCLGAKAATGLK